MKLETNSNVDLYSILKLHHSSSEQEVRQSYRRLALLYHPDRNPGREEHYKVLFQQLSHAYETLTDVTRRAEYDRLKTSKHVPHPAPKTSKRKPKKTPKAPPQHGPAHGGQSHSQRQPDAKYGTQSWFRQGTSEHSNPTPNYSAYYARFRKQQDEADQKYEEAKQEWGRRFPRESPVKPEARQQENPPRRSQGSTKKEPTFTWMGSSYAGGTSASRSNVNENGHPRFRWTDSSQYWAPTEEEVPNDHNQPRPPAARQNQSTSRPATQDTDSSRFRFAVPRSPTPPAKPKQHWQNPLHNEGTKPKQSTNGDNVNEDDDVVEISETDFFNARREARTPQPSAYVPGLDEHSSLPSQRKTNLDPNRDAASWRGFKDALNSTESGQPEATAEPSAGQPLNSFNFRPPGGFEHNFAKTNFFDAESTKKTERNWSRRTHPSMPSAKTQAPDAMDMDPPSAPDPQPTDSFSFSAFAEEYPLHNQLNDFSDLKKAANEMSVQGLRDRMFSVLEAMETPRVPEVRDPGSLIGYRIRMTAFLRSYDEVLEDLLKYMHRVHIIHSQFHRSLRTDGNRVEAILEQSADAQRVRAEWSRVEHQRIMALQAFHEYFKGMEESNRT